MNGYLVHTVVVDDDNVRLYMNNNSNNDDVDLMVDEFLRRYSLIHDERVMYHQNSNVVGYVSYEDLNLNY